MTDPAAPASVLGRVGWLAIGGEKVVRVWNEWLPWLGMLSVELGPFDPRLLGREAASCGGPFHQRHVWIV